MLWCKDWKNLNALELGICMIYRVDWNLIGDEGVVGVFRKLGQISVLQIGILSYL